MEPLPRLVRALDEAQVRFVLIGVWAVNLYARSAATVFTTHDYDLFLPPDADNELLVAQRALVRASDGRGFDVDLTLTMAGFEFEEVWAQRRTFALAGVEVPVARLRHVVESKAAAGREKDRLFLASHAEALRDLLRED